MTLVDMNYTHLIDPNFKRETENELYKYKKYIYKLKITSDRCY